MPGTQHFRNIRRHRVLTDPRILALRVDESLYFANARYLKNYLFERVAGASPIRHVILQCLAINEIDISALESPEAINHRLESMDVKLHLSEIKGPVMERLRRSEFLDQLTGSVFLSHYEAVHTLSGPSMTDKCDGKAEEMSPMPADRATA